MRVVFIGVSVILVACGVGPVPATGPTGGAGGGMAGGATSGGASGGETSTDAGSEGGGMAGGTVAGGGTGGGRTGGGGPGGGGTGGGLALPADAGVDVIDLMIPSGGSAIAARLFSPAGATTPLPGLSLLPGGGASISSVEWAAVGLARSGYVVVITLPSSGGSLAAYHQAAVSGLDFLVSSANPVRSIINANALGVAGWSLGARALSRTQEEDPRVKALVAWDNLATYETGDLGAPNCMGSSPTQRRTPRVPAMGQASDFCGPPGATPETKKVAFEWWRMNQQPTMQVVFAQSTHFVWGSPGAGTPTQALALAYTTAWFDRWLKNDLTATARLLSRYIGGVPIANALSPTYRSAASFDGVICADLRQACP
jgi:hypothetical protein